MMNLSYPEKDTESTVFDADAGPGVTPAKARVFTSKFRWNCDDAIDVVPEQSKLIGIRIPDSPGCPEPLPTNTSSGGCAQASPIALASKAAAMTADASNLPTGLALISRRGA